jgi:AcrR family transcriptional regulator
MHISEPANLRERLLEAGKALLATRGPEELSLREVARACGVSHNAPYRHFKNKEELLAALAEQGYRQMSAECLMRLKAGAPQFEAVGEGYLAFCENEPSLIKLMLGHWIENYEPYPSLKQAAEEVFSMLTASIDEIQPSLEADQKVRIAVLFWAMAQGLAQFRSEHVIDWLPEEQRPTNAEMNRLLLNGLIGWNREP